jgi:hypothetical protein
MIPLKTPSSRRPGWEAFVLGYTSEFKVRPLHQGYVSATSLCIYIYIFTFYLSAGYFHLYCTGPLSLHSCTRCMTKWTMLVKNLGGNTYSSLHKVIQTSLYSRSNSFYVNLVEHMPLKNPDISTKSLTTLSSSDRRNAIKRSCCIST